MPVFHWTVWRGILALIALLLIGSGITIFVDARQMMKRFNQLDNDKPMEMHVDLSEPGEYVAPFHQTSQLIHVQGIVLVVPPETLKEVSANQLLRGFNAGMKITRISDDKGMKTVEFEKPDFFFLHEQGILIFWFKHVETGEYQATLTITQGASALRGVTQKLEARYLLDGAEWAAAVATKIAAYINMFLGGLFLIILYFRLKRKPVLLQVGPTS